MSKGGEPLLGQVSVRGVDLDQVRPAAQLDGCDAGRPAASERISHEIARLGEVLDQPPHAVEGLLKRVDLLTALSQKTQNLRRLGKAS